MGKDLNGLARTNGLGSAAGDIEHEMVSPRHDSYIFSRENVMKISFPVRAPDIKGNVVNVILNIILIAVIYAFLGLFVSILLHKAFPAFTEEWKDLPTYVQVLDVLTEYSLLAVLAFFSAYIVDYIVPYFPIRRDLETYMEVFGGRLVFAYVVYIFVGEHLDQKVRHIAKPLTSYDVLQTQRENFQRKPKT